MNKKLFFAGLFILTLALFFSKSFITGNVIGTSLNINLLSATMFILGCALLFTSLIHIPALTLEETVEDLSERHLKGKQLAAKYSSSTWAIPDQIRKEQDYIRIEKKRLYGISSIKRAGYRLGEFIGRSNPENEIRDSIASHLKKVRDYEALKKHREKRLETYESASASRLTREYEKIKKSMFDAPFYNFTPENSEQQLGYLETLKNFNKFYSALNQKLKELPQSDSDRIKSTIMQKYFRPDNAELPYVPGVEDLDKIISNIRNEYRQPKKMENGKYEVTPENLVLVHKTNYLPEQQKIRTTGNATHTSNDYSSERFLEPGAARQTVHFTLNHPVRSHEMGNWDDKKYAVLVPAEGLMNKNVVALDSADSYTFGNVPLKNKGAEIVISHKAYRTMSPREINRMKKRTGAELVYIANEGETLNEAIKKRVKERGYSSLDSNQYGDIFGEDGSGDALSAGVARLASGAGKDKSMHTYTPFHTLEATTELARTGRKKLDWGNPKYYGDMEKGSAAALADIKEIVSRARGGDRYLTDEDLRTLKKLEKVVENYKYSPAKKD